MTAEDGKNKMLPPEPFDIGKESLSWSEPLKVRLKGIETKYLVTMQALQAELSQLEQVVQREKEVRAAEMIKASDASHADIMANPLAPHKSFILSDRSEQGKRYETLKRYLGLPGELQFDLAEVNRNPVAALEAAMTKGEFNKMAAATEKLVSGLERFLLKEANRLNRPY